MRTPFRPFEVRITARSQQKNESTLRERISAGERSKRAEIIVKEECQREG
jgi:hypothetical protein